MGIKCDHQSAISANCCTLNVESRSQLENIKLYYKMNTWRTRNEALKLLQIELSKCDPFFVSLISDH